MDDRSIDLVMPGSSHGTWMDGRLIEVSPPFERIQTSQGISTDGHLRRTYNLSYYNLQCLFRMDVFADCFHFC